MKTFYRLFFRYFLLLVIGFLSLTVLQSPDLPGWSATPAQVRVAMQKSVDWLTATTQTWDSTNNCYGCHVQAQAARALAIGIKNQFNVNSTVLRNTFMQRMVNQQAQGGNPDCAAKTPPGYIVHDPCTAATWIWNPTTVAAAPAFAFYSRYVGSDLDGNLISMADYLSRNDVQTASGSWGTAPSLFPGDTWCWDNTVYGISECATQSLQFTANALMAINRANQISPKAAYVTAMSNGLAYLRSRVATVVGVQDITHLIMGLVYGLNVSGSDPDIINLVNTLISWQNASGGWGYNNGQTPTAYSTGEVLNAFEAVGITISSEPTGSNPGWVTSFNKAVDWMLANQNADGSYATGADSFVNTMWAVVGTGSAFGPLTVSITTPAANGIEATSPLSVTVNAVDNDGSFDVQRFALYLEDLSASGPVGAPEVDTGFVAPGTFSGSVGNRTWTGSLPIPATPGKSFRIFARAWNTKATPAYYDSPARIIHNISSTDSTATAGGGPSSLAVAVKAAGGAQTADAVVTIKTTGGQPAAGRTIKISTTFGTIENPPGDTLVTDVNGQATFKISSGVAGSGVLTIKDITDAAVGVTVTLSTTPGVSFYSVGGFVYNDLNKDGIKQAGESGIGGVTLKLSNGSSKVTLADGFFFFGDPIAAYTLTEIDLAGYGSTTDNIQSIPAAATDINFGDYTPLTTVVRADWNRYHEYGNLATVDNQGSNGAEANLTFNSNLIDRGLEWAFGPGSSLIGGPVVVGTLAYVTTADGNLRALNLGGPSAAWTVNPGGVAAGIAPTVATIGGTATLLYGNTAGSLMAYNASTGAALWNIATGGGAIASSPAVIDGTVYATTNGASGAMVAYDLTTRKLKWKNTSQGALSASGAMAVRNSKVFVPLVSPARVVALDQLSGVTLWTYPVAVDSGVTTDATNVYFVSGGTLYSVRQSDGGLNFALALSDAGTSTVPALSGTTLYVGGGNKVKAYSTAGALLWESPALGVSLNQQSPTYANGLVYIAGGGKVFAVKSTDGTLTWSFNYGGSSTPFANVVALNDRLYVPSQSNTMFYSFFRSPRIQITKSVFTDAALTVPATSIQPNQTLWYKLLATNIGEAQANSVVLKDTMPATTEYVAGSGAFVSGAGVVTPPGSPTGTIQWSGFNLAKNASVTVKFQVTVK